MISFDSSGSAHPGRLATLDRGLLLFLGRIDSTALTRTMRTLTRLGDTESWVVAGLALGAAGGHGLRLMLLLALGAALATAVSQVLKRLACRPRPAAAGLVGFAPRVDCPDGFSFPSGHTAVAFAVTAAMSGESALLGYGCLLLACGIGTSRIYLGAHYPLDVAAGVVVGTGAGCLARFLVDWTFLVRLLATVAS